MPVPSGEHRALAQSLVPYFDEHVHVDDELMFRLLSFALWVRPPRVGAEPAQVTLEEARACLSDVRLGKTETFSLAQDFNPPRPPAPLRVRVNGTLIDVDRLSVSKLHNLVVAAAGERRIVLAEFVSEAAAGMAVEVLRGATEIAGRYDE